MIKLNHEILNGFLYQFQQLLFFLEKYDQVKIITLYKHQGF